MAIKLAKKDFSYYKKFIGDMKSEHDRQCMAVNTPDETIAAYQGQFAKGSYTQNDKMPENYLLISALTVLPTLYFQNPRIIVKPKRESLSFSASVLQSLVNTYFDDAIKRENQLCIIDAFLPWGFGVSKIGYNSRTGKVSKVDTVFKGKQGEDKPNDIESSSEYIVSERPVILRCDPRYTYLDYTQPFGKGQSIDFEYRRTLRQLIDSNMYELSSNFIDYFTGRAKDAREVDLTLHEYWVMLGDRAWKLAYVDEWDDPLSWNQTEYNKLPVSYLEFNKLKGNKQVYPFAHGTAATYAQKKLNFQNELWDKHIENIRDQYLVWADGLTERGLKTLNANVIGGIVEAKNRVTEGLAMPLQSGNLDASLFGNIEQTRSFLQTLLSTTGGKAGSAGAEKATEMKLQASGDAARSEGMMDDIRDFMTEQVYQTIRNIVKMGNPKVVLKLTGKDLIMPLTGEQIKPGDEIEIGGKTGFDLKELIAGDVETDYLFSVDITSAQKPDFPVVRKQLMEALQVSAQLEPLLRSEGKKIDFGEILKSLYATFDAVPDAEKFLKDLTEEEKIQMTAPQGMPGGGGPQAGTPDEMAMMTGAGTVPSGVEGLAQA